jgi:hypothetical protein
MQAVVKTKKTDYTTSANMLAILFGLHPNPLYNMGLASYI